MKAADLGAPQLLFFRPPATNRTSLRFVRASHNKKPTPFPFFPHFKSVNLKVNQLVFSIMLLSEFNDELVDSKQSQGRIGKF